MTYSAQQITAFIQLHYPRTRTWNTKALVNWVSFFMSEDFCLMAGEKDRLMGVVLLRPTMTPLKCNGNTEYDMEGDTLFIDMAVMLSPKIPILQCLAFSILKRFGQRDKLAYQRQGKGDLIITDAKRHRRKLLTERKEVHGI